MSRSTTPLQIERNGYRLTLDAVQAWICSQCRAPCFEEREVDAIQDTISLEIFREPLALAS